MQKNLSVSFNFENDSFAAVPDNKKQIDAIFCNNSPYDMQLFCRLDLPFGFTCDKNEFDVICPAQGTTYASMYVTLKKDARIFYETYTFSLNVFDNVTNVQQNFDFDLYNNLDSFTHLDNGKTIFSRTYVCENDVNATISISAQQITCVKLSGDVLFDSAKPISDLQIPIAFKKGVNQLQITHTTTASCPFQLSFPDGTRSLNLPFIIQ